MVGVDPYPVGKGETTVKKNYFQTVLPDNIFSITCPGWKKKIILYIIDLQHN